MAELTARALDALPHAVFVVDALRPGRPNAYVNEAYSALTGYSAAEAVSASFDAFAIFVDPTAVAALGSDTEARSGAHVRVRRRDGTTFAAKLRVRALPHGDGRQQFLGLLGLDPLPEEAFLSWLNHELRSPLSACVMWLDVLTLGPPQPDTFAKAVEAIRRNLARQTQLVNELSGAAKVLSDSIEVRLEPVDVAALIARGLDGWQSLARAKQLALRASIGPGTHCVDGDPERLLQALNHLLDSAIASTPAGGRVELRVAAAGHQCSVEIEDTGAPLSAEDAANLGAPLWRAAHSAKTRAGLGLGLAVAHHVAIKHGGSLTATSGSAGTQFVLTLPLAAGGR